MAMPSILIHRQPSYDFRNSSATKTPSHEEKILIPKQHMTGEKFIPKIIQLRLSFL
jgi:hypothetical protein